MSDTSSSPRSSWGDFNGGFFAFILVSGVFSVFFLLYFNRVFASIVSYFIRTYTWHKYQIYLDFQALQISLLAGRIFFIGLRYHGNNETILIHYGHITWSYWLRRVRDVGINEPESPPSTHDEKASPEQDGKKSRLPCRINIVVSGIEWFVYNRSAAYNSVLDAMIKSSDVSFNTADGTHDSSATGPKPRQRLRKSSEKPDGVRSSNDEDSEKEAINDPRIKIPRSSSVADDRDASKSDPDDLPTMLRLFPIHLQCDKAALVMGNPNTKAVLIVKTQSFSGEIDASTCQTPDPYRQLFKLRFTGPVVQMKPNRDYKEDQLTRAVRDKQTALTSDPIQNRPFFRRQRRRILGQLRTLVPYWRKSVESFSVGSRHGATTIPENQIPGSHNWQGLTRYLNEDEDDDKLRWSAMEYAAVETIIDSPEASLTILWDVPGKVGPQPSALPIHPSHNINGAAAPAWSISLSMNGGTINYGPWADRHRAELQKVFFPSLCKDAIPAAKLPVGANRVPTVFNFYVEIDNEVTLRIPTKEDSKNWRWREEADALRDHLHEERQRPRGRNQNPPATTSAQQRPYGWLDIKVASNATVSYSMDMLAGTSGYSNTLNIDLPSTEVSTSVNHGVLWRSGAQRVSCDLSTPLKWNSLRNWRFSIDGDGLELFLLRDHIFLLTDLVSDWGSGPPADYLLFTPFKYLLDLKLRNLKLYLNVNDVNVVNNPIDFDDNTYIVIESPCLLIDSCIPLDNYRPPSNAIPFDIRAETLSFNLHIPPWNTQAMFLTSREIGHLENISVNGKYHYLATTSPANTDTLVLNVSGQSPTARLHGFLLRYFLQLKDNYFGDHVHFKTLDEYQESIRLEARDPEAAAASKPPPKKSNDLDVMLSIRADDPKVLLPANMYSSTHHLPMEAAYLAIDLRFTNYYMDLEFSLSPLSLSDDTDESGATSPLSSSTTTQLFIDGLNIYGHRVFGLPPVEPTYMCNWDLAIGAITGECSAEFLTALIGGGKAFGFSFDDEENALIPYSSIVVYDVTFLRLHVASVSVWLHVEDAAFLCSTGTINVNYNDWARSHYSKRADISIPSLELACVNPESAARRRLQLRSSADTDAFFRTSIRFALIGRKHDFAQARKLQQELIRRHDQRTQRADFLVFPEFLDELVPDPVDPAAQSVPSVPQPVQRDPLQAEKTSLQSTNSFVRTGRLRHKSSFLSLSSSSNESILHAGASRSRRRRRPSKPSASTLTPSRPEMPTRDASVSTSRHSAFYSAYGDFVDKTDPQHSTVTFSSQYFGPYFPFDNVRPDFREAALPTIERDENEPENQDGLGGNAQFTLDDIDPENLAQDCAHQSLLLELPAGISAFCNAASLKHVATLISALQPKDPEDILDALQIRTITDVLDWKKEQEINSKMTDFVLKLPHASIRFLNDFDYDFGSSEDQQDQYDLTLRTLAFATRSRSHPDASPERESPSKVSFHFRLDSAEFSAAERLAHLNQTQAAVVTNIDKVMISMGTKDIMYIDGDVGCFRTTSTSGKIEYLASLIHRTNCLATEMGALLSATTSKADDRLRHLAYTLLTDGQRIGDPMFIIRPSAILRVADNHLRTSDSWKLIMRLRQLWTAMDHHSREHLTMDCLNCTSKCPVDGREQAMKAFERWRKWDLDNLSNAFLLNNIFGKVGQANVVDAMQILAVARIQQAQLILDPGPKENHAFFVDLTLRLEDQTRGTEGNLQEDTPITVVNVYCGHAGLNLNWELCELADDVLKLFKDTLSKKSETDISQTLQPRLPKQPGPPRVFHVVTVLALGSAVLETVNLTVEGKTHDLKLSVVAKHDGRSISGTNAILECDASTSRIWSHSQPIGTIRFKKPSIFVGHDAYMDGDVLIHAIKAVASSDDLRFVVKQDPVALAEIADMLIRDEVAQIYELQKRFPNSPQQPRPDTPQSEKQLSARRINLAMFLDSYTITLPLLRSITYSISGVVARATLFADLGRDLIFDFDIKENSHHMQVKVNNTPRSISLLQIPPTNGRVTSHSTAEEHSIAVFASLELVQLDASAVYSLLSALNRPEISSTIEELQQQGKTMEEHIREIFGSPEPKQAKVPKADSPNLVYDVHGTLAGLEIFGTAPLHSDSEPLARLLFCLDSVHLHISNKAESGIIVKSPEVHANLRRIMFDIEKGSLGRMRTCGNLAFGALITASTREADDGTELRSFGFKSDGFELNLSSDAVATVIDVVGYLGDKIKDLDTSRELEYLRKLRQSRPKITINDDEEGETETDIFDTFLSSIIYSFEIRNIQVCWLVTDSQHDYIPGQEDLVLSFRKIEFGTRQKKMAKLTIDDLQLQMVPPGHEKIVRTLNSALMPEAIFNIAYVSTDSARRLAFQAVGKPLDIRLTSAFIIPVKHLQDSITLSTKNVQQASENWAPIVQSETRAVEYEPRKTPETRKSIFGSKRLESLLIDADFAGAVVHLSAKQPFNASAIANGQPTRLNMAGKYGQFGGESSGTSTVLRTPGLALKSEYRDNGREDPTLYGELLVEGSRNILYPSVVPLVLDITSSIKEVVSKDGLPTAPTTPITPKSPSTKSDKVGTDDGIADDENILTADPSAVLGRMKLNLGLRICEQEFTLSSQPIGRVAATMSFGDIYITANTVHSPENGNFFAISGTFSKFKMAVQHVYSRESTASFDVDSIVVSLMNSKHVSGTSGISAIIKVSPMEMAINARQLQDFWLFREIWLPRDVRAQPSVPLAKETSDMSQGYLMQRYQQVAATAAFPWTATLSITALKIKVDLGQSLGKSELSISDFWISSKKTSDWEQNLCLGFQEISVDFKGRLSGLIALQSFKLRTSIKWPERKQALNKTPRIQASIGFSQFRLKAVFDYQAFLIADITTMEFLMYNVRQGRGDRLVAAFDGGAVQVFGVTSSASQVVALWQAIQKLIQERQASYESSLRDIEKFIQRRSVATPGPPTPTPSKLPDEKETSKSPISLDTDVVVALKALNLGVFPSTFSDRQVFKLEATNAQAGFAATMASDRIHSILQLTLGQLRIGLASVRSPSYSTKSVNDLTIEDVVLSATGSRGGTILKVPKVEATMQTWQKPDSRTIEYIFKSAFEGKVEVGWNYSRIVSIRGMWANHSKLLAQTWGHEIPAMSAIKVTGVPEPDQPGGKDSPEHQQKITAELNVPQSKFEYVPLKPPVIETPQLRDMGEATPPLEWIGINRDKLPNLTHQIVIVSLLELAGEVEDAYAKILGSS